MIRILLGDDSADVRDSLERYLSLAGGLEVEVFETGEELVERARRGDYDGIVTDYNYGRGKITGLEVVKQIRKFNTSSPIYLHTGEIEAEKIYGSTPGLTGVLGKSKDTADKILGLFSQQ